MIPKFRAYDKVTQKIFDVEYIDFDKQVVNLGGCRRRYFHEVETMQATGLTDKKGVEIYEGDIIQVSDKSKSTNFVVSKSKCDFVLIRDDFEELLSETISELKSESEYNYNVIGNIYENPELVEV